MLRFIRLPKTFRPTHQTGGLPGFPAIDVFGPAGRLVFPPEGGRLVYRHMIPWDREKRVGGLTVYLQGDSGATYFLTHFGTLRDRPRIRRWLPLGRIAAVPGEWWAPHIHEGKHAGIFDPLA